MKATTLINNLTDLVSLHGDLVVMDENGYPIEPPEYNEDDEPRCILVSFDNSADSGDLALS